MANKQHYIINQPFISGKCKKCKYRELFHSNLGWIECCSQFFVGKWERECSTIEKCDKFLKATPEQIKDIEFFKTLDEKFKGGVVI